VSGCGFSAKKTGDPRSYDFDRAVTTKWPDLVIILEFEMISLGRRPYHLLSAAKVVAAMKLFASLERSGVLEGLRWQMSKGNAMQTSRWFGALASV
jgi:hypothetical protein